MKAFIQEHWKVFMALDILVVLVAGSYLLWSGWDWVTVEEVQEPTVPTCPLTGWPAKVVQGPDYPADPDDWFYDCTVPIETEEPTVGSAPTVTPTLTSADVFAGWRDGSRGGNRETEFDRMIDRWVNRFLTAFKFCCGSLLLILLFVAAVLWWRQRQNKRHRDQSRTSRFGFVKRLWANTVDDNGTQGLPDKIGRIHSMSFRREEGFLPEDEVIRLPFLKGWRMILVIMFVKSVNWRAYFLNGEICIKKDQIQVSEVIAWATRDVLPGHLSTISDVELLNLPGVFETLLGAALIKVRRDAGNDYFVVDAHGCEWPLQSDSTELPARKPEDLTGGIKLWKVGPPAFKYALEWAVSQAYYYSMMHAERQAELVRIEVRSESERPCSGP